MIKAEGWFLPKSALNKLQQASVSEQIERCKQSHFTNIRFRTYGEIEEQEADWIKHLIAVKIGDQK